MLMIHDSTRYRYVQTDNKIFRVIVSNYATINVSPHYPPPCGGHSGVLLGFDSVSNSRCGIGWGI